MGLDIRFIHRKEICCPKCGELVTHHDEHETYSSGRVWYELLTPLGYYVPHNQVTEENNWYGKDMVLTREQSKEVYKFVMLHNPYNCENIKNLIATATYENDLVVINADW